MLPVQKIERCILFEDWLVLRNGVLFDEHYFLNDASDLF